MGIFIWFVVGLIVVNVILAVIVVWVVTSPLPDTLQEIQADLEAVLNELSRD